MKKTFCLLLIAAIGARGAVELPAQTLADEQGGTLIVAPARGFVSRRPPPPGVVITCSPAETRSFIGSPSIAVLPNGGYVASHDFFGPGSSNQRSVVFGSSDRGATWRKLSELDGQWWSTLFVHREALYILGTTKEYGNIVIRRSTDGGETWSKPSLLREDGGYHCAPMPVTVHDGRLWRAFEQRDPPKEWGVNFCAGMLSAPVEADLLNPANWTTSNFLRSDTRWLGGTFGGWLEGNAVVSRDGSLLNLLRVDTAGYPEKAAVVQLSRDGKTASFDPLTGFIDFPGGAKKFTIRYDAASALYWSVATLVPEQYQRGGKRPGHIRNTLALICSPDLTNWSVRSVIFSHPDIHGHGFQYVDWLFDGNDIIAVCRTAWDGARNFHDANYLTFERITNFRAKTMAEGGADQAEAATYRQFNVQDNDKSAVIQIVPSPKPPLWARDVSQSRYDWGTAGAGDKPVFETPIPFVVAPAKESGEPFYKHNHQPSITWLPNGDLLACWFSTDDEAGTEMTVLASRKRVGAAHWDPAAEFFKAENRNMTGSSLFQDGAGTLFHFNGMGPEGVKGWGRLALLLRTSRDNGVTWTTPRFISRDAVYGARNQAIAGTRMTRDGVLLQPCDAVPGGHGGAALHISRDGGKSWTDPGAGKPAPDFKAGGIGQGTIAGIHAGVVELNDGRLMALGRGDAIEGHMPLSISADSGKTWTYSASPFPPIGGGQRLVLLRLREGPLLLVSFTCTGRENRRTRGMEFTRADGTTFRGFGLFAAISEDEGKSWPIRKLITPGSGTFDGGAWTREFTATPDTAEHAGYLTATQTPDGLIQLLSSRLHYRFNLAWLKTKATITVHNKVLHTLTPDLIGLNLEDLNFQTYGGLDSQLLHGQDFEEHVEIGDLLPGTARAKYFYLRRLADGSVRFTTYGLERNDTRKEYEGLKIDVAAQCVPMAQFSPEVQAEFKARLGGQRQLNRYWQPLEAGLARGNFTLTTENPFNGLQDQSIEYVASSDVAGGEVGIANGGLFRRGIKLEKGRPYEGLVRLRSTRPQDVWVSLRDANGKVLAETKLLAGRGQGEPVRGFEKHTFTLTPSDSAIGRFAITLKAPGAVTVGYAFLQPGDWGRYQGLPLKREMVEALKKMNPRMIRYNGGMVSSYEPVEVRDAYRWKKMIGPRDLRIPYNGTFNPFASHGFGLFEALDLCNAIDVKCVVGIRTEERVQDYADLVEYANGAADTEWGARRAADGHPKPYGLKYIGFGNEQDATAPYAAHFKAVAQAVWAKDPNIIFVIGDTWASETDEHKLQQLFAPGGPIGRKIPVAADLVQWVNSLGKGKQMWWDLHCNALPFLDEALYAPLHPSDGIMGALRFKEEVEKLTSGHELNLAILEENGAHVGMMRALSHARNAHAIARSGKLIAATVANALQAAGLDYVWGQGKLFFDEASLWPQPPFYVDQMISRNWAQQVLECRYSGGRINALARKTEDGKALVITVVNFDGAPASVQLNLAGFAFGGDEAVRVETLAAESSRDENTSEAPLKVAPKIEQRKNLFTDSPVEWLFPQYSFTLFRIPLH